MALLHVSCWESTNDVRPLRLGILNESFLWYGGWASEILHQLIDGKHPMIYRVSTTQIGGFSDFAGPSTVMVNHWQPLQRGSKGWLRFWSPTASSLGCSWWSVVVPHGFLADHALWLGLGCFGAFLNRTGWFAFQFYAFLGCRSTTGTCFLGLQLVFRIRGPMIFGRWQSIW